MNSADYFEAMSRETKIELIDQNCKVEAQQDYLLRTPRVE